MRRVKPAHRCLRCLLQQAPRCVQEKLEKNGIVLSKANQEKLLNFLKQGGRGSLVLEGDPQAITIELDEDDLTKIKSATARVTDRLPQIIDKLVASSVGLILPDLKKRWPEEFIGQEETISAFRDRLYERWAPGIKLLHMILTMARELGANARTQLWLPKNSQLKNQIDVVTSLQARACQVTDEILCLLRAGFSEAALARWRTLHEIAVVSALISQGNEELAKKYVAHQYVESLRAADEYQRTCVQLGRAPIPADEVNVLRENANRLISEYGKAFAQPMGWAAVLLKSERPQFDDLERLASSDKYRSHYRWASHGVHAGPKSIYKAEILMGDTPVIMTGPTNSGLAEPAHATALSLARATASVVTLSSTLDLMIGLKMIFILVDEAGEAFLRSHETLAEDEAEARRTV